MDVMQFFNVSESTRCLFFHVLITGPCLFVHKIQKSYGPKQELLLNNKLCLN